ncbi:MAG: extracellular solute-binding protein [Candidatus Lokiarchaeota archaeon]
MPKLNYKLVLMLSIMVFSMGAFFLVRGVVSVSVRSEVISGPKTSQGVDLNIIVTDQQLPGVQNVTQAFLNSPLGHGVNSVTVLSSGTNANDQLTTLMTAMAAGSTTYDVMGLDVIWTAQFAGNGWIIPLDSYITSGSLDDMNNFAGGMVDACTYNGHYYVYPYFMNLGILYYRKDLMDQTFGIGNWSESDFGTWEGLNQTANYILNNETGTLTNLNLVGYVGQFDNYEGGTINFFEIAGSNGATDLISDNTVNIANNTKLADAMTFFQNLVPPQYTGVQGTPYIIPRNGLIMDEGSSVSTWAENNSIFMRQWTFGYAVSNNYKMDFGIVPLPHFQGASNYKTSCVGGSTLAIPTFIDNAHRAAAINLSKFLGMPTAQEAELKVISNFPALKSVYSNPPTGYEWISNWTSQLDQTLSRPLESKYPLISTAISNDFSNILSGGKTVTQGLNDMQTIIEQILKPGTPGIFTLTTDAENPDSDGTFHLTWTSSEWAENYSIYMYNRVITKINQSLTLITNQSANSPYLITGLDIGEYYYVIVAYNDLGSTLSNCVKVTVEKPSSVINIPGYSEMIVLSIITVVLLILIFKTRRSKYKINRSVLQVKF